MSTGQLVFAVLFGSFLLAVVIKGWLFLSVVQGGLHDRGVPVDDGKLALRGSFGRYTRIYLSLLDADERRLPHHRWISRLQWLVPLLGAAAALSAILASLLTGP